MRAEPVAAIRPGFVFWVCLWSAGLAIALVATVYDVVQPDIGTPPGRDFSNLYTAGRLALEGNAYRAFNLDTFRLAIREYVGVLTLQNYSYPPHAMFIAAPFALLPYGWSFVLWTVLGFAFFYWAAKPYVQFAPILTVLTPAAALNTWNGHYGLLLGGLWLFFFRYLKDRPVLSGLIAASMTFKPHMGLFIGLAALSNRRVVFSALFGLALLVLISAWAFDWTSWLDFIGQTMGVQAEILTRTSNEFYFRLMPSAYTAYGRGNFAIVAQTVCAITAVILVARYRRIDPFVFATATFLIVPYVFVYDMTVACLGFAIILQRDWPILARWECSALAMAFLSPGLTILFARITPMLVPPILLAALYIQTKRTGSKSEISIPIAS